MFLLRNKKKLSLNYPQYPLITLDLEKPVHPESTQFSSGK